jgi:hypothetical protein
MASETAQVQVAVDQAHEKLNFIFSDQPHVILESQRDQRPRRQFPVIFLALRGRIDL